MTDGKIVRRASKRFPGVYWNDGRSRWEQRIIIDGKRLLHSASTDREVAAKVAASRERFERGLAPREPSTTVGAFLAWWLDNVVAFDVKPTTATTYRHVAASYIVPHVGSRPLGKLSPADVTKMIRGLDAAGMAPNTQRAARSVLRRALRRAQVEGLVSRNVAALADGVRVPSPEGRTMTPEQARTFLEHVRGDRLGAAFAILVALGLRRGELLGLAWADIELTGPRPSLRVGRTLSRHDGGIVVDEAKTRGSRRTLDLPSFVVAALEVHRETQDAERAHAGELWVARPLGLDLVFRTESGTPLDPANFKRRTHQLSERAGIGRWGPHELRHTAASLLLGAGVPLKTVSETLGHGSIRITADVYGHLLPPARLDAADAAQRVLFA